MTSPASPASERPGVRQVLSNRNFRLLWLGQSLSDFGDGMNNLALLLLIEYLTGSTAALATAAVFMALPRILFGPMAGVYADRQSRKRLMIISDLLRGFLVLGYILVGKPEQIWILYLVGFLQASVSTFFTPARSALVANLLPENALLAANSLSQTSQILMNLLGMAAVGALVGALHLYWPAFVVDSLTFFASLVLVSRIRVTERLATESQTTWQTVWQESLAGVRTIFRSRTLVGVLAGAGVAMLGLGAINILFVPLLIQDLHVQPTWFSAVQGAQTAAMILSGSMAAALAAKLHPTRIVSLALVGLGVGIGLISRVHSIAHVLILVFGLGLFITPLNAAIATLTQTAVADALRGRVGASLNMLVTTANIASMAAAGALADGLGTRTVFVLAGGLTIAAGMLAAWLFRGLARPQPATV